MVHDTASAGNAFQILTTLWLTSEYKVFICGIIGERDLPDHMDLAPKVADDGVHGSGSDL